MSKACNKILKINLEQKSLKVPFVFMRPQNPYLKKYPHVTAIRKNLAQQK